MTIKSNTGVRLPVLSVTAKGPALVQPQSAEYSALVRELHRRLADAGADAKFHAGLSRPVFGAALISATSVLCAMAALLIRSLLIGSWGGAFFMAGFAALFVWQVGGFIRQNRPERYSVLEPPERLLPKNAEAGASMRFLRAFMPG
jgi:hypothetical protein